jgi:hypothetical protein
MDFWSQSQTALAPEAMVAQMTAISFLALREHDTFHFTPWWVLPLDWASLLLSQSVMAHLLAYTFAQQSLSQ